MDTERFSRSLCFALDVEKYSQRIESQQERLQARLRRMLLNGGGREGLPIGDWTIQEQGDGFLVLAPLDESEPRYIDGFVRRLTAELRRENRERRPEARLRLRFAVHHGVAYPGDSGFVGDAAILVCRLRDSEACRNALAERDADLVLIVSPDVYHDVVAPEHTTLDPAEFTPVVVAESKVSTNAWIWSPRTVGTSSPGKQREDRKPKRRRDTGKPAPATVNRIERVKADYVHFGTRVDNGGDGNG